MLSLLVWPKVITLSGFYTIESIVLKHTFKFKGTSLVNSLQICFNRNHFKLFFVALESICLPEKI